MRLLRKLLGVDDPDIHSAPLAPETMVYVVGDIHGRHDLLERLLVKIDERNDLAAGQEPVLVLVGDFVDRGDQSAEVLRCVHALSQDVPNVVCLMGNHERMMLDFIDKPAEAGPRWLRYGGLQTLASFGVGGVTENAPATMLASAAESLRDALGLDLESWIRDLPYFWVSGNLVVTHAALDPDLPLEVQSEQNMLWGHPDFMRRGRSDGLWVAHGHTVVDMPVVSQGRISVDTGAVFTGRLTAALLRPGAEPEFIQG